MILKIKNNIEYNFTKILKKLPNLPYFLHSPTKTQYKCLPFLVPQLHTHNPLSPPSFIFSHKSTFTSLSLSEPEKSHLFSFFLFSNGGHQRGIRRGPSDFSHHFLSAAIRRRRCRRGPPPWLFLSVVQHFPHNALFRRPPKRRRSRAASDFRLSKRRRYASEIRRHFQ